MRYFLLILLSFMFSAAPAVAGAFEDGVSAMERKDYADALKNFQIASTEGSISAQHNIGVIYLQGLGIAKDYVEAMKWLRLAADQGYASSQYDLAFMYDMGLGVTQDRVEAVKWAQLAANQGNVNAFHFLGESYKNGQGVPKDYATAMTWYLKAAEQNYLLSLYALGIMYHEGLGIQRDELQAYVWLNLALRKAEKMSTTTEPKIVSATTNSRELSVTIARNLTPGDLARGQQMIDEWLRNHPV